MASPTYTLNGTLDGPSPASARVLDVRYLRHGQAGGGAGESLPAYAGGIDRPHVWSAPVYNAASPVLSLLRGLIAVAQYVASEGRHLVFIGDSKIEGLGGGTFAGYSMPGQVRRMLSAVEGFISAQATGQNNWDDRWVTTGFERTANTRVGVVEDGSGSSAATFTSDFVHTGGSVWVSSVGGGSITISVDGGSAQSFSIPAGGALTKLTPVVTGNTAHVYVLSSPLPDLHLLGFAPTYQGAPLKITNLGVSGSSASGWLPGAYTAVPGTGLWESLQAIAGDADAVFVGVGTNVPNDDGATNATRIATLYSLLVGLDLPVIALAPGGIAQTTARLASYKAIWDAADAHNLPVMDFASVIGDQSTASQRGLMYDNTHENATGYVYEAAAVGGTIVRGTP